jgi:hypothetical protein
MPKSTTPVLLIVLSILFGNILYLVGYSIINPISFTAGVSHILCHVSCGRPMIDPNVGYITQPLGHLSAEDLLHGHLPFWNYFEGVGQPLAGEMQSAALFPLTLLFALPSGLLWFHMALEIIGGVSTYFLARRLSIPTYIATVAGILFALNGTFAWLGNAVLNPIAFLPMLLLGIEMIYDAASKATVRKGWYVAAIAIALSIYAGFPEVAYIDGLFCLGWAIVRFFSLEKTVRWLSARRVALAGLVGVVLALPILVPFSDFLKVASVGGHAGGGDSLTHLPSHAASMFIDPYIYGGIFSNPNVNNEWGGIGGYFGASVVALALLGLFGKKLRPLRIFLGVWSFLAILGIFNIVELRKVWNIIPLLSSSVMSRYIMPSCELALIVLCVLGIMDFSERLRAKRLFNLTNAAALLLLIVAALSASALNKGIVNGHKAQLLLLFLHAAPFVALGGLLIIGIFATKKFAPVLIGLIIVAEALLMFVVPTTEAAKQINIDNAPLTYLQTNQGEDRFLDFAILNANWGSQFDLNSLSAIDLPFPRKFSQLIQKQLFPGLTPANQFVIHDGITGINLQQQELATHFSAYEDASVKYLLFPSAVTLLPSLAKLGVHAVFEDDIVTIYEMPKTKPFFSTASASCTVSSASDNQATVNCAKGATTLTRTELSMPGWHAYVNGHEVPITTVDSTYQQISVPAGTSSVTYSFTPPHEKYALLAAFLAALFLIASWLRGRFPSTTPRHRRVNGQGSPHSAFVATTEGLPDEGPDGKFTWKPGDVVVDPVGYVDPDDMDVP